MVEDYGGYMRRDALLHGALLGLGDFDRNDSSEVWLIMNAIEPTQSSEFSTLRVVEHEIGHQGVWIPFGTDYEWSRGSGEFLEKLLTARTSHAAPGKWCRAIKRYGPNL